jgi:esterase/lipase superfamily enzyme
VQDQPTCQMALERRATRNLAGRGGRIASLVMAACLVVASAGCGPRAAPEQLIPRANAPAGLDQVRVLAVTDRAPADKSGLVLSNARGAPRFEDLTIGVRPFDPSARVEPDLATDFVTLNRQMLSAGSFDQRVASAMGGQDGNILVFVHGYNYSYQEGVFRLAQMSVRAEPGLVPILFSWPSQGQVEGYIADRDGVSYARDDLVALLIRLTEQQRDKPVMLVGHSMGAWLVMESLRQLRLQGRDDVIDDLQVALAAPDIDVDLFRRQISTVGKLSPPLTVLVSPDDRALAVSSRVGGGRPRLGAVPVDDPGIQKLAQQAGLRIVDISNIPAGDALRHDRFAVLADRWPVGGLGRQLQSSGAFILDTTGQLIAAPFSITAEILAGF